MRVFSLPRDHLHLLDQALQGRLSAALAAVARAGGDPVLLAERVTSADGAPSTWFIVVAAQGQDAVHRFEVNDVVALGVAAHIYLADFIDDLKTDLARRIRDNQLIEAMGLDEHLPWPPSRRTPDDLS